MAKNGLTKFVIEDRNEIRISDKPRRKAFHCGFGKAAEKISLAYFVANYAPTFYREIPNIVESLQIDRTFLTAMSEALQRIPTSESFQDSHFGEIFATLFAEEVLGLARIYSKLSLLTAENANAYKMDVVCYDPKSDPVTFVFCEVKISLKHSRDGMPPKHDQSCYASLFKSFRSYGATDLDFDLATIKDRLHGLPEEERKKVRMALMPYAARKVVYLGMVLIDSSTKIDDETKVLIERKSKTEFEAELVTAVDLSETVRETFKILMEAKRNVQPR